jgi:site-specific recombinase XerC
VPAPEGLGHTTVTETLRGSRAEADRVLRERLGQVDDRSYVSKSNETVADFIQKFMETYVTTNTTLRTQQGYPNYVRQYIDPALGTIRLQSLTAPQIQRMYAGMLGKGLSNRTVLHCHRLLKQALRHAVKWGVLVQNPAEAVDPPRPERKDIKMWDNETIHTFLEAT